MSLALSPLRHVFEHAAATNVLPDQHHLRPSTIPISNVGQMIEPLPGGPGEWDIAVPFDATLFELDLVAFWQSNDVGGRRGGRWISTRSAWQDATGMSFGGPSNWRNGTYPGMFTRVAGALDVSHRIFSSAGFYIALTDAYLAQTGPTTRVCRTVWTNYGAAYHPLWVYGEIRILG